ncbi:F-box domain-containing protein [Colletotrichum cereale]|nr:F-box domain-containing protein [Colletotrichum cereale]
MTSPNGGQITRERRYNGPDVDEHFIAECFSQLTSDNGSPDVSLRQANLCNLAKTISPWELIYLRSLIRKTTAKLADLPDLPEEIVATVSAGLNYQDVLNCTKVSRGWRRAWTADMVVRDVARAHFTGLVESHPDVSPWSLLRPVAARAAARAQGRCVSSLSIATVGSSLLDCTALKLDDRTLEHTRYTLSPAEPLIRPNHAYCDGRIAWQSDAYSFFIDDIRSTTRTLVSPSDLVVRGEKDFVVSGLSSKLLVLANTRTARSLIVYHLEKNQYRRVALPSRMHQIHLHKETFLVTFRTSLAKTDPHLWRWGGGLTKLKVPDLHEIPLDPDGLAYEDPPRDLASKTLFISHPTKTSLTYLANGFLVSSPNSPSDPGTSIETYRFVIVVHKFNDTKHIQTFHYEENLVNRARYLPLSVHCQPINAYGLYSLSVHFKDSSASVASSEVPGAKSAKTPSMILSRVNFNTISETFSCTTEELNGMRRPLWDPRHQAPELAGGVVWNDLIYYIQNHKNTATNDMTLFWKTGAELSGVRSLCIVNKTSTQVINEDSPWFTEREGFRTIAVDDDFLVAISDKGYVVWNHGDFGLREKPWERSHGSAWRLQLTTQDIGCPVQGCLVCSH